MRLTALLFLFCFSLIFVAFLHHLAEAEEKTAPKPGIENDNSVGLATNSEILDKLVPPSTSSPKDIIRGNSETQKLIKNKGSQESVFDPATAELLVLQFHFDQYVLSDGMIGYLHSGGLYIPLGEVAAMLNFAINVDPTTKQAEGWFIKENRRFFLNMAQNEIIIEGKSASFDPSLVFLDSGDIFVDSTLLGEWLPVSFEFDLSGLQVEVSSEETLPFEDRLRREETYARLGDRGRKKTAYPQKVVPYSLLSWPAMDSSFDFNFDNDAKILTTDSSTRVSGDLLFMNTELFVAGDRDDPISTMRLKMKRQDSENKLFGSLNVSQISMGDIFSFQVPLIANSKPGAGLQVSSFPLLQESEFDRINLRGELQVGWEAEIYRNEILLDVQTEPNADGRYEFLDVPLLFGSNVIRVVTYGPQGQKREKVQQYNVGSDQAPPGKTYFRFSTTLQNRNLFEVDDEEESTTIAGDGKTRFVTEFQHGINRQFSLTGSLSSFALESGRRYFGTMGVRTGIFGALSRFDMTKNDDGGTAIEAAVLTKLKGMSIFLEHTRFFDFQSERENNESTLVLNRSNMRLESSFPSFGIIPRIPWSLTGNFERREEGVDQIDLSNRLSIFMFNTSASNTIDWSMTQGSDIETVTSATGSFQLSGRIMGLKLRGSLDYLIKPVAALSSTSLSTDFNWSPDFSTNLGVTKQLGTDGLTTLTAGVNRRYESFAIGVDTTLDDQGSFTMGSSITYSFGREPRKGSWLHSSDRMASSGMVSARVFIDANGNQVFDEGDKPLEGAKFKQGSQDKETNEDGIIILTGLSSTRPTDIVLDISSLEDPFLVPLREGYEVVVRPGQPIMLDFPVAPTGEVDGTVFLQSKDTKKTVSNVELQLVNAEQEVVLKTTSEFDGFYLFQAVPIGKYWLQIAPDQIKRLKLKPVKPIEVVLEGTEAFIVGLNFILEQKATVKKKAKKINLDPSNKRLNYLFLLDPQYEWVNMYREYEFQFNHH